MCPPAVSDGIIMTRMSQCGYGSRRRRRDPPWLGGGGSVCVLLCTTFSHLKFGMWNISAVCNHVHQRLAASVPAPGWWSGAGLSCTWRHSHLVHLPTGVTPPRPLAPPTPHRQAARKVSNHHQKCTTKVSSSVSVPRCKPQLPAQRVAAVRLEEFSDALRTLVSAAPARGAGRVVDHGVCHCEAVG